MSCSDQKGNHDFSESVPNLSPSGFIAYKLKTVHEDFQVTEICNLPVETRGKFAVYELKKSGWNTVDLLSMIARQKKVSYDSFRYGGKKDRHASTLQFVTTDHKRDLSCEDVKWSFKHIGYSDMHMGPEFIHGNHFSITLRAMHRTEIPVIEKNYARIRRDGFINYFDEQRFGGKDRDLGLAGIHIFRGDYERALLTAMTGIHPGEKKHARDRKLLLREKWGDWVNCERIAVTGAEKRVFRKLINGAGFREAMSLLPGEELSMIFSAAQSWIWNKMIGLLVQEKFPGKKALTQTKGGPLIFPCETGLLEWMDLYGEIPVPGPSQEYGNPEVEESYEKILASEKINANLKELRMGRAFLGGHKRDSVVVPRESENLELQDDPAYPKRRMVTVRFILPPGSYATMLIKNITLRSAGG